MSKWLCPGCERRSGKLYLAPRRDLFKCRVCYDLSYESAQASRARYYDFYKSLARQCPVMRRGRVCRATPTFIREAIREGLVGAVTVAPYTGIPHCLQ